MCAPRSAPFSSPSASTACFARRCAWTAGGPLADAGVGFLNGALAGLSGLAGILVIIWCQLRGWTRDQQRTVFQPVAIANFLMSARSEERRVGKECRSRWAPYH